MSRSILIVNKDDMLLLGWGSLKEVMPLILTLVYKIISSMSILIDEGFVLWKCIV